MVYERGPGARKAYYDCRRELGNLKKKGCARCSEFLDEYDFAKSTKTRTPEKTEVPIEEDTLRIGNGIIDLGNDDKHRRFWANVDFG